MTVKFSLIILFGIIMIGFQSVTADDSIDMMDIIQQKDGTQKIFGISGHTSSYFANMTVRYPDGSIGEISSVPLTDRGNFQTFVVLHHTDPAGLYEISITPYNNTNTNIDTAPVLSTEFLLTDYDGLVDIHIPRNSVVECDGSSENCLNPGITHIPKSFGVRFFNDDFNNHQIKIGKITGELVLPDGDSIIFPEKIGSVEYGCIIHPWVNGELKISDVPDIKYVILSDIVIDFNTSGNIITGKNSQIQYDVGNCGQCYVGTVTKVIDGDTIHVDGKSIRLALVDTPEEREDGFEESTNFVVQSCPVGSRILVDVDDLRSNDGAGAKFAKITCGDVNVNESLMAGNLASLYNYSCTESEFMYDSWATHNCEKPEIVIEDIPVIPNVIDVMYNTTSPSNSTVFTEIISETDYSIVYILVLFIAMLLCFVLIYQKKNSAPNTSFSNTIWLD